MKIKAALIIGVLALSLAVSNAQTNTNNPVTSNFSNLSLLDSLFSLTNWTALAGYGHSVTGVGNNLAFQDFVYKSATNANVGVVIGFDQLWGNHHGVFCTVKGGATLQTVIRPFSFLGSDQWGNEFGTTLAGIEIQPFIANVVAQANNSSVGNITTAGFNYIYLSPKTKNFSLGAGLQWEYRAGQGTWDGNYLLFHLSFTRRF